MPHTPKLGKLESVEPRTVWSDEAKSFTPWLAKEENIHILGETVGVDLEVDDTEVSIGSFKADIVCKAADDSRAVIENQLAKTNHDHLGKIITYASGLDAKYIIWLCDQATEEHRRAVDWLNETSVEGINYFLLEIELWRIGDSEPAPKFNVVCSPNEWANTVKAPKGPLSDTRAEHLAFWNGFKEYMTEQNTFLRVRTPRPSHWYSLALGRSRFNLSLTRNTNANRLGCEVYIRGKDAKKAFAMLQAQKEEVEAVLGELDWQELPEGQDCRIVQHREVKVSNKAKWDDQFAWLKERAEAFHGAFSERVKALEL